MASSRAFLLEYRWLALALVALALLARAIVPTGYMIASSPGTITVAVCNGQGVQMMALELGKASDHSGHQDSKTVDRQCAFSGLGMVAAAGADSALLVLAIAFILTLGVLAAPPQASRSFFRLRPPLRAPPLYG